MGLYRNFGHGLTHVAIVVHDLANGKPALQQVVTVKRGAPADFGSWLLLMPQRLNHLVEKQRHSVVDLRFSGCRNQPRCDLRSTSVDDFSTIEGDKFVEHADTVLFLVHERCSKQYSSPFFLRGLHPDRPKSNTNGAQGIIASAYLCAVMPAAARLSTTRQATRGERARPDLPLLTGHLRKTRRRRAVTEGSAEQLRYS